MNKKLIVVLLVVFVIVVAVYAVFLTSVGGQSDSTDESSQVSTNETVVAAKVDGQAKDGLSPVVDEAVAGRGSSDNNEQVSLESKEQAVIAESDEVMSEPDTLLMWEELDLEVDRQALIDDFNLADDITDVEAVMFNLDALSGIAVGDQLELPSIGGNTYVATVSNVQDIYNGNISIKASYEAYGESYTVRVTQGSDLSFVTVTTPEGNYQLQVNSDGEAVIISEKQLDDRIDTSVPDVLIPPAGTAF